jgi:hypothetical protein
MRTWGVLAAAAMLAASVLLPARAAAKEATVTLEVTGMS